MRREFRTLLIALLAVGAMVLSLAQAATPEEGATEAAQAWAKAMLASDVETQMKLLPATMFSKPDDRERYRLQRLHEKETALINKQKYLAFDIRPPSQTLKFNKTIVVVVPYQSVKTVANGKLQINSVLIAMAGEGSNQWSVFDGSGHSPRWLKVMIPGYTTGLALPPVASKVVKGE